MVALVTQLNANPSVVTDEDLEQLQIRGYNTYSRIWLPDVLPLLRDNEPSIRRDLATALLRFARRSDDVLPHVLPLLRDDEESVRSAVARALGELGPAAHGAVPALAALLDDDSQDICETVLEALARIEP